MRSTEKAQQDRSGEKDEQIGDERAQVEPAGWYARPNRLDDPVRQPVKGAHAAMPPIRAEPLSEDSNDDRAHENSARDGNGQANPGEGPRRTKREEVACCIDEPAGDRDGDEACHQHSTEEPQARVLRILSRGEEAALERDQYRVAAFADHAGPRTKRLEVTTTDGPVRPQDDRGRAHAREGKRAHHQIDQLERRGLCHAG